MQSSSIEPSQSSSVGVPESVHSSVVLTTRHALIAAPSSARGVPVLAPAPAPGPSPATLRLALARPATARSSLDVSWTQKPLWQCMPLGHEPRQKLALAFGSKLQAASTPSDPSNEARRNLDAQPAIDIIGNAAPLLTRARN